MTSSRPREAAKSPVDPASRSPVRAMLLIRGSTGRPNLPWCRKPRYDLARGCGNPTGFAQLKSGEVVVDFGCGGGIDVILAAHKVGPQGKVVGIDMAPHMIERA